MASEAEGVRFQADLPKEAAGPAAPHQVGDEVDQVVQTPRSGGRGGAVG
jgi:hypothetical protein